MYLQSTIYRAIVIAMQAHIAMHQVRGGASPLLQIARDWKQCMRSIRSELSM